jgi:hypothetical protein
MPNRELVRSPRLPEPRSGEHRACDGADTKGARFWLACSGVSSATRTVMVTMTGFNEAS